MTRSADRVVPRSNTSLPRAEIDHLADLLADELNLPPGTALALEGSHAEGFGNDCSDVDFLVIYPDSTIQPTLRTTLHLATHRVEVRSQSVAQLTTQLLEVVAASADELSEDLLDRCQRFLYAVPVWCGELIDRIRERLPLPQFDAITARWWARQARLSLRYAVVLAALGAREDADGWARNGAMQAMKYWAARRGECYMEPKWLDHQLDRLGAETDLIQQYRALTGGLPADSESGASGSGFLTDVLDLARQAGLSRITTGRDDVRLDVADNLLTWEADDVVHVFRDRLDVFVLQGSAAEGWRSLSRTQLLTEVTSDGVDGQATGVVAEFLRLGFLTVGWAEDTPLRPWQLIGAPVRPVTPPPSKNDIAVTMRGGVVDIARIGLSALPATRFAAAGMSLVWSDLFLEITREDLTGALQRRDWPLARTAAHRMVMFACRSLLSAHGVEPLPQDTEIVRYLGGLACEHRTIAAECIAALQLPVTSEQLTQTLHDLIGRVRAEAGSGQAAGSLSCPDRLHRLNAIVRAWVGLNSALGLDVLFPEALDLLTTGSQPHLPARSR
ncbi:hypothetical protein [Nocardia sp. NPDC050175]|uniref:hypothetical protein n=1 Tax=Nocardia sp. NPDC050175 TaxID=3364317 RepID=UPI00378F7208